jgi:hypothetical protein
LYVVMRVLKVIEVERYVDREPLAFVDALARWPCVHSCVSHLHRSGRACDQAEHHRTSVCVEMLVVLHGLLSHALKVDRVLFKPIVKLKTDSPESQDWCM